MDLYYSEEDNRKRHRPHRTPAQLLCRLLRLMLLKFPQRTFLFIGDSTYGTHEVARLVCRHRDRLTLISKLHPEANLFEPPPPYKGLKPQNCLARTLFPALKGWANEKQGHNPRTH